MSSMFWGLRLEPKKRYSTTVDKSFHVSMAALDCASVKNENEIHSVMLDDGESEEPFILCNLEKSKLIQSPLDLHFNTGDRITIYCKGNGTVHLTGYIVPEDEIEQLEEEEDDEDEEEELEDDNEAIQALKDKLNGLQGKRKVDDLKSPQSKRKKVELDEGSDDSDDDDMVSDEAEDESMGLEGLESDEDDDEDDEEEDESDEESEEETKLPSKPFQQMNKNKKNKTQLNMSNKQPNVANSNKQNIANQNKQNTSNLNKQQNTPNLNKQQNSPNLIKQQNQGKQPKTPNGVSPNVQSKKDKKKGDKTPEGTPSGNLKLNKSNNESPPSAKKGGEGASPGKKTLEGGVMIKEGKLGNGPVCKAGKTVCVYYTGRFKNNNKVFDSTTQGAGFKFRVGSGEVIKGWDVGIVGMKVGGKRFITCPPHMAYGQKGSPPTIPGNSTLVFEVELKSVK